MKAAILVLMSFAFIACAKNEDSEERSVYSNWRNSTQSIDFTEGKAWRTKFVTLFSLNSGVSCSCSTLISGGDSTGLVTFPRCIITGADEDPLCTPLVGTYSYSISDDQLTLCQYGSSTCQTLN